MAALSIKACACEAPQVNEYALSLHSEPRSRQNRIKHKSCPRLTTKQWHNSQELFSVCFWFHLVLPFCFKHEWLQDCKVQKILQLIMEHKSQTISRARKLSMQIYSEILTVLNHWLSDNGLFSIVYLYFS